MVRRADAQTSDVEEITVKLQGISVTAKRTSSAATSRLGTEPSDSSSARSPTGGGSSQLPRQDPPPPPGPGGTAVETRVYLVLRNAHSAGSVGIWTGAHPATWNALAGHLRGGVLFGSGASVRRCQDLDEAVALWRRSRQGDPPIFQM